MDFAHFFGSGFEGLILFDFSFFFRVTTHLFCSFCGFVQTPVSVHMEELKQLTICGCNSASASYIYIYVCA